MRHHGTRSDHRHFADGDAGSDGGVRADRRTLFNNRQWILGGILAAARKAVVCKGSVRADEHVIAKAHAIPKLDAAFYRDPIADHHVILNKGVIADIAILADRRSREYVGVGPDPSPFADGLGFHDGG